MSKSIGTLGLPSIATVALSIGRVVNCTGLSSSWVDDDIAVIRSARSSIFCFWLVSLGRFSACFGLRNVDFRFDNTKLQNVDVIGLILVTVQWNRQQNSADR